MSQIPIDTLYESNRPVFSVEFFPPKNQNLLVKTIGKINEFSKLAVDFMTVTYGAGGESEGFTFELLEHIKATIKKPVVSHLTCVGKSKKTVEVLLDKIKNIGIKNILALRGDIPLAKDNNFEQHFEGAKELIQFIKSNYKFCILTAGYPETHRLASSASDDIRYLKEKIDNGAKVILTQLFFDPQVYIRFQERCSREGINVPIVPGILPVRDYAQLTKFTSMCNATIPAKMHSDLQKIQDQPNEVIKYGTEQAINICQKLLKAGAPGVHFYSLNQSDQVKEILKEISG